MPQPFQAPSAPSPKPATHALTDPRFLAAVLLLIANDAVFKGLWPGWITGKLSDVAGLFAWTFFWSAPLPRRFAPWVAVVTGAGFVYWKSPAADGLIAWWNATAPVPVGRVVDFTDLLALAVLPLAVMVVRRAQPIGSNRLLRASGALSSMFAFAQTSFGYSGTVWPENLEFQIPRPRAEVVAELVRRGYLMDPDSNRSRSPLKSLDFRLTKTPCDFEGRIVLTERGPGTVLKVRDVKSRCVGYQEHLPRIAEELNDYLIRPLENWLLASDTAGLILDPEFRQALGCYSIRIGRFHPRMSLRQRWIPGKLELVDSLGWWHLEGHHGRRMVLPDREDRSIWWEPITPDSFRIAAVRNSEHLGIEIRLPRGIHDSVEARAITFGDETEPTYQAPAMIRRAECRPTSR